MQTLHSRKVAQVVEILTALYTVISRSGLEICNNYGTPCRMIGVESGGIKLDLGVAAVKLTIIKCVLD